MALPLTAPVASILSALIAERLGIHFGPADIAILADKVSPRARERGFESLLDYYYLLRYDDPAGEELTALAEHLVVNETYFFREIDPLTVIVDEVIAPRVKAGERVRIWSAACSTGEEPLTLAMMLADRDLLSRTSIVASDVSARVLERAQGGSFGKRSVRGAVPGFATPWLSSDGDRWHIDPSLARHVVWRRLNLVDFDAVRALGVFDVVLCRNVFIYFSDETGAMVLHAIHDVLRPGGILALGVAESALRFGSSFLCEERSGAFLYRKAAP